MSQITLRTKKKLINDEFYTQYNDIARIINDFTGEDPFMFNESSIYCPCDSSDSEFFKFFKDNFTNLGISELTASEWMNCLPGKWWRILRQGDSNENPIFPVMRIGDFNDCGDFRSHECHQLMEKVDYIITNPPFSLARDFFRVLLPLDKKFIILGNLNMINYKELIPSIVKGDIFVSHIAFNQGMTFNTPFGNNIRIPSIVWFTNIDFPERYEFLSRKLLTKKRNEEIYANTTAYRNLYRHYDNYTDIIEVPKVSMIPKDYYGLMGVPITFIGKHCPLEYDIKWIIGGNVTSFTDENLLKTFGYHPDKRDKGGCPMIDGKRIYSRIVIQRKKRKINI